MSLSGIFRASLIALCLFVVSCTTKVSSLKTDKDLPLEANTGYLFLTVDTDFDYSKFSIVGPQHVFLRTPDLYKGKNYYLVPVEAGEYKVDSFVDSWGGIYTIADDENEDIWTFNVKSGGISYIGDFKARRLYGRYSHFELVNNASYALEYLEEKYPNILSKRTLEYSGVGEDFFYGLVREKQRSKSEQMENKERRVNQ